LEDGALLLDDSSMVLQCSDEKDAKPLDTDMVK